jgi:hypothetical protein
MLEATYNGGLKSPIGGNAFLIGFHADNDPAQRFQYDKRNVVAARGRRVKLTIEALFVQARE